MFKDKALLFKRGVSVYLALMIISVLLAIALGMSTIFLEQTEMLRGMGYSVLAFYAADAGTEQALINRDAPLDIPQTVLTNGATYQVFVTVGGTGGCTALHFCIKSVGTYQETRRAIEIVY